MNSKKSPSLTASSNTFLKVKGARQHNLKNVSLNIPKGLIVVFTGVSGSGKSSLVFDTIFAEGQRRYLEYLSPDVRASIKQMPRPDVDFIEGLSPTLAVSQHRGALSQRSTVATHTDIYDFLAILYSNIGEQHSPATGKRLQRYNREEIVDIILKEYASGSRLQLISPIKFEEGSIVETVEKLYRQGFIRLKADGMEFDAEYPPAGLETASKIEVIVDRIEVKEGIRDRLASSIDTIMELSKGILIVQEGRDGLYRYFTEIFVCPESGYSFPPLTPSDFNFNSLRGACLHCHGKGGEDKVVGERLHWDSHLPIQEQVSNMLELLGR